MVIASGLGGQFGMVAEVTYGTPVTVTRFLEFNTESLAVQMQRLESRGIGTGRFLKTDRHKACMIGASGSVEFDVMSKGFGLPLKMALGANTVAQQGATSEYLHTIQPEAGALAGIAFTAQVGRPSNEGTSRPFTYEGCKVTAWELSAEVDGWLKLNLEIDAEAENTGIALASASYASGAEPFSFCEGAVTIGGSPVSVRRFSIKGTNALKTDRRFIGNTKKEPLANGEWVIEGELEFEFEALTRHAAMLAETEQADLVITFDTGDAIPTGNGSNFKIVITVKAFFYNDGHPNIGGPDVIMEPLKFKALDDGTNPVVKVQYYTTDTEA